MARKMKKGEIWKVNDRHGRLVIKLDESVDTSVDTFFNAEILKGKKSYMSIAYNWEQQRSGIGTVGRIESFRTTLCKFTKKLNRSEVEGVRL